jgi:hypothetical protein
MFYCEKEIVSHLFFECCVAKNVWSVVSEILGLVVGNNFEFVATLWVMSSKYKLLMLNLISS